MSRYELTISPEYVKHWTPVEAIREIFQNALDSEGKMSWNYGATHENTLCITSTGTKLSYKSLLMGHTTKALDSSKIGQFGEGFKLALLVLARCGHYVEIQNSNEVWVPKLVKSRRFDSTILTIDITKKFFSKETALTFVVNGITEEMFAEFKENNFHLNPVPDTEKIKTGKGSILLSRPGDLFVHGLFVEHKKDFVYGYDLRPGVLTLDRDRRSVSEFNLSWVASQMWAESSRADLVAPMLFCGNSKPDVCYLASHLDKATGSLSAGLLSDFYTKYGAEAIPVTSQHDYDILKGRGYNPIFSNSVFKDFWQTTPSYVSFLEKDKGKKSPFEIVEAFLGGIQYCIPSEAKIEAEQLLTNSRDWIWANEG